MADLPSVEEIYARLIITEVQAAVMTWDLLRLIARQGGAEAAEEQVHFVYGLMQRAIEQAPAGCREKAQERADTFRSAALQTIAREQLQADPASPKN